VRALVDVTHDLMVCVGRAVHEGYVVAFVEPDEYEAWYAEEQGDRHRCGDLMTVWQPLADLGWQNFFCDEDNIIVRFEVIG
jgi:hypothetical protein